MTNARKMTLKRLTALLDSYGADPLRWPVEDRVAAEKLLASSPEAATTADRLDAALDVLPAPKKADHAYIRRLGTIPFAARAAAIGTEATPATFQEFLRGLFPVKSLLPQGAALALAGMLGIWLGFSTAAQGDIATGQLDASQYLLENPDLGKDLEQFK